MAEDMVINRELLRAIGGETRIAILKALQERQKTQSELAKELQLAAPTVLGHLEQLEKTGLVQKLEEGRKWKYYHLTAKARQLLGGKPMHVVILLGLGLLAVLGVLFLLPPAEEPVTMTIDNGRMDAATMPAILESSPPEAMVVQDFNETNSSKANSS